MTFRTELENHQFIITSKEGKVSEYPKRYPKLKDDTASQVISKLNKTLHETCTKKTPSFLFTFFSLFYNIPGKRKKIIITNCFFVQEYNSCVNE